MMPTAGILHDVVSLLGKITMALDAWYVPFILANALSLFK